LTEETVSELGSGASGRAWETKKPFWIADVSQHDSFVRGPVAQQAGIRAGVWVPVLAGGHVVALLEFLMFQPGEPEARLVELVTAAAGRVGSLILRKRAENALRRSEERFRLITRATTDGVWDWDLVNNHVWRSESYASLFLYKPEEVGTDNKWFMDRVHPEDRERIMAEFKTARDEGAEFHANEYRFRRADGQYAYVCDRAYFLRDERGVAVRAVGGMVDMTGRRQAEDTLRQSEERYRSLVASSMDAVLLATPEGGILTANEAACQMFGCSAQELTAKGRSGVVDGSDPRVAAALQERDRTGRFRGEVTFVRKDGTKFPGEISSVVFTSGEGQRLINVVIRDITERKRMEEALRRSEQVHRASIEASGAVPYTRDFRANCYEFMGAGIERLIGYAPHECVSGLFENIVEEVVIPGVGTFRTLPEAMRAFSGTGATLWAADYRVRTRDGRECWLTDAAVDERDASGRVVRSVGMLFNITPRKRAEAALKELNETLEQRVAERTALAEARARELAVSEERLREQTRILQSILNSMGDGVVVRDEQMRCLWFNPAFERITGLCPPNLPVEQWQAHYGIFLPDGVTPFPTAQHPMLRALRGEAADNVEMVFRNAAKPQGVVVSVTSRPVRDENGAIRGGVSVLHDITRRKRAEQLLRESEERLRTIVENLNEGVVVATLDGRLTQWNRAALEMHGYTRLEEGQRGLGDFADTFELSGTDGTVWPVEQWPLSRIYRGEHLRDLEVRLRRIHSDWERVFSYGGSLVRDAQGQPLLAVVTVRDITELKRAEETLRESENRYRSLVESATDIIFKVAANGKLVSLNRAFETITGWPCERWIGQLFPPLIHPDDLARAREELDHAVRTGETRLVELRVRSKSGAYLPMEFRGTPYEESGRIAGLLCIARDVTERKRAEEMLRESEARYRNLVESALDIIFTLGADGTVQSLNHAFEQVTGWPCSEWIGRPYAPLFHPHD
ncbi:MAG: PAS domain S-box protein, partial [Verrucomicrobia bacterium]|nr:PAS domain S-box protein [Verrucomicrobiota bacterium]